LRHRHLEGQAHTPRPAMGEVCLRHGHFIDSGGLVNCRKGNPVVALLFGILAGNGSSEWLANGRASLPTENSTPVVCCLGGLRAKMAGNTLHIRANRRKSRSLPEPAREGRFARNWLACRAEVRGNRPGFALLATPRQPSLASRAKAGGPDRTKMRTGLS
jgi:hypothetical protein